MHSHAGNAKTELPQPRKNLLCLLYMPLRICENTKRLCARTQWGSDFEALDLRSKFPCRAITTRWLIFYTVIVGIYALVGITAYIVYGDQLLSKPMGGMILALFDNSHWAFYLVIAAAVCILLHVIFAFAMPFYPAAHYVEVRRIGGSSILRSALLLEDLWCEFGYVGGHSSFTRGQKLSFSPRPSWVAPTASSPCPCACSFAPCSSSCASALRSSCPSSWT